MTAHAVGSLSVPTASKSVPTGAQGPAGAVPFEHQLHAARQLGGATAQDHAADHGGYSRPESDATCDRGRESSSSGKSEPAMASPTTPAPVAASTAAPAPALNTTPLSMVEVVAGATPDESAPVEEDGHGSEQDAAALVGAMLAMIGPVLSKTKPVAGASGQLAATDADTGAASLLPLGDATTLAASTSPTPTLMPVPLLVADVQSLAPKIAHDSAGPEITPGLALSALAPAALAVPSGVPVSAPLGSHAFAQELGQQVAWFVGHDVQQARIRLHPEELGSLDLKISVNHGRVDVIFHAQHPGAVTAVQQSLPALDQMLAQHGLSLGNTEVGQHGRGDQRGQAGQDAGVPDTAEGHVANLVTPLSQIGLLDAFA